MWFKFNLAFSCQLLSISETTFADDTNSWNTQSKNITFKQFKSQDRQICALVYGCLACKKLDLLQHEQLVVIFPTGYQLVNSTATSAIFNFRFRLRLGSNDCNMLTYPVGLFHSSFRVKRRKQTCKIDQITKIISFPRIIYLSNLNN